MTSQPIAVGYSLDGVLLLSLVVMLAEAETGTGIARFDYK
jgi:hypothetical protein